MEQPLPLTVSDLSKSFGGLRAVQRVSLSLEPGERRVIIGPNGAGKSTLFNLIGGALTPSSGRILLFGQDVTRWPPYKRAGIGLARTFQITSLFPNLTVLEHLLLALQAHLPIKFAMHRPIESYGSVQGQARQVLMKWEMWDRRDALVRDLSYGEQRQLEIVLAVAAGPRLVLLDEPTAGLSPAETRRVADIIHNMPRNLSMLLIEHDLDVAFQLAERVTVMHQGEVLTEGTPAAIRADARVMDIYLGSTVEA
jgi:branched-chain amino acid transport system ATP-binding protein